MRLQDLQLHLSQGVHLLSGSSGCGKSTFLKILAGELPIQSGKLKLGQLEVTSDSNCDFSAYIEYMPQEVIVIRGTVKDNVLLGRAMHANRLDQAIESADLEELLQKLPMGIDTLISPNSLSSGEKQKIALARVFYSEKPVWVLDEPTSALDPSAIQKVMKRIMAYGRDKTIIMTSHQASLEKFQMKIHFFERNMSEKERV